MKIIREENIKNLVWASAFVIVISLCSCGKFEVLDWKKSYKPIVDAWESDKGDESLGYEFIYLDEDDIPELILYCYDEAWEGFDIYTYADGKAIHLDRYDLQGEIEMESDYPLTSNGHQGKGDSYVNKAGILFQRGGMMGCYWVNGYKLDNGRLNRIVEYFYSNSTEWAEEASPISYEIRYKIDDNKVVTRNIEEDVHFENCYELPEIERVYSFLLKNEKPLPSDNLLTYDEVMDYLDGKRVIIAGYDYTNVGKTT